MDVDFPNDQMNTKPYSGFDWHVDGYLLCLNNVHIMVLNKWLHSMSKWHQATSWRRFFKIIFSLPGLPNKATAQMRPSFCTFQMMASASFLIVATPPFKTQLYQSENRGFPPLPHSPAGHESSPCPLPFACAAFSFSHYPKYASPLPGFRPCERYFETAQ